MFYPILIYMVVILVLQNVIRNWYARDPDILETEDSLVDGAWECAKAFEDGKYSLAIFSILLELDPLMWDCIAVTIFLKKSIQT